MRVIETFALSKHFGRLEAVHELNLRVTEGSVYALMGPNGAGKTTLIKMLMNLIRPTSGRALILGGEASRLRGRGFEPIGYVSENQKLPPWMTVSGFLAYLRPFYPTWELALERQLLEQFELPAKQKIKHLSRGMKMKAALASVLAYRPKLIVLDEPLSGLDPLARDELMEALVAQAKETTVLFSSHDLAEVDTFATHVGFIDAGRLELSEPMVDVREHFRSVTAVGLSPLARPEMLPKEWIQFSFNGTTAQWIETAWDDEWSPARAREVFGRVEVKPSPMTLRDVFLILAKSNHRQHAGRRQP